MRSLTVHNRSPKLIKQNLNAEYQIVKKHKNIGTSLALSKKVNIINNYELKLYV